MKRIYNIHDIHTEDKLYCKVEKDDNIFYHIFKLGDVIIKEDTIVLNTINCFTFQVPVNRNLKAFLYNDYTHIEIKKSDSLFKLSKSEYLDTYLCFMKNDKKFVYELPDKLIQDL